MTAKQEYISAERKREAEEALAQLRVAARAVLDGAERPGARMCLNGGPNGEDTWEDYKEVPQVALDQLEALL